MKLRALEARRLSIPFRFAFKHAAAERRETETLWVTADAREGVTGTGESCPRVYVTGEDVDGAIAFVLRHASALLASIRTLSDVASWAEAHRAEIDRNPAAWCAVELALIDALGRRSHRSVESLLGLAELEGAFRYSAVLGDMSRSRFREAVAFYRGMGMREFKLKISGRLEEDGERLDWLRASAPGMERVRLDANNLWEDGDFAAAYLENLPRTFFAVEEPLSPGRYRELAALSRRLGVAVVLDESFLRAEQLDAIAAADGRFVLNVRVSKMGGLLRSLASVRAARRLGIPVVVGAQVGETSLLTRAALPVAREAAEVLLTQEGAFGDRLLVEDPWVPSLAFGRGGLLPAPPRSHGLA